MNNVPTIEAIPYRRWFPWLEISRAFSIALDVRNVAVALLGLVLMYAGHYVLLRFIPGDIIAESARISMPEVVQLGRHAGSPFLFSKDHSVSVSVAELPQVPLRPYRQMLYPASRLFFAPGRLGSRSTWPDILAAWSLLFWDLIVWSFCAGAITRQAGSQFARQKSLRLAETLRYSRRFFLSYFSAPLLPFVAIGALFVMNRLVGLFALIPGDENVVIGLLWFIPLLFSLLLAIIIFCIAICWPLMFPAISVEGSDAFDGLSRSYGYLTGRPWQMAWYVAVAVVFGIVVIAIVQLILMLTMYLSIWSGGWLWDPEIQQTLQQQKPFLFGGRGLMHDPRLPTSGEEIIVFWMEGMNWLLMAFVYSYFWCAATIVYFLLRRSNDGTEMSVFYLPSVQEIPTPPTFTPTLSTPPSD
ncbi:MAG: hypothetical protein WD065_19175 [Planctomycetaceae bacterium]